jgi:hypothetical protein
MVPWDAGKAAEATTVAAARDSSSSGHAQTIPKKAVILS